MRCLLLLVALFCVAAPAIPARAQSLPRTGSGVDAPAPLVVMNLAAHPDDEDGATLAYYRHAKDAVAYSVLFTRGEGGQNEAGPELYERLGAIRTRETEHAARLLGTQVYYLNFYDFGFSKHAAETFREWSRPRRGFWDTDDLIVSEEAGRDTVTARLVYLIRRLKPDVLFTNHDTTTAWPNAQHGHHQAVGIAAYDAFALAADSTYHPEQLAEADVDLWQPQRLFLRRRGDGPHDVAVPVSDPCPPPFPRHPGPHTCAELAVSAVRYHHSQGFDKFAERFRRDTTYFTLLRSAPGVPPLPEGTTDLAANLPPNPHAANAPLAYLLDSGRLPHAHTYVNPRPIGRGSILASSDLLAMPGEEIELSVCRSSTPCNEDMGPVEITVSGALDTVLVAEGTPPVARLRLPADLVPQAPAHHFQYDRLTSHPPLLYQIGDGADYLPVFLMPPVWLDLAPEPIRLVPGENEIPVQVRTHARPAEVSLTMQDTTGALVHRITRPTTGGETVFRFHLPEALSPGRYRVEVAVTGADARPYVETRPAALLPDVRVAEGLRVGFVRSYDQVTENALRAMGAEVVVLDSTALASRNLDDLDTIVLDIRAYLVRPDLRAHNARLLGWVRRGGHLVVGYHKTFEWNPGQTSGGFFDEVVEVPDGGFAPYPLTLGRERITVEEAPVTVLRPEHVLFHEPHAITAADWRGWVQERGLYFPAEYDGRYAELLAMADPGEDALRSGLLLAEVGDGTYLYSPLVFYRQLEALNVGAWRLFANLVSLPLTDGHGE